MLCRCILMMENGGSNGEGGYIVCCCCIICLSSPFSLLEMESLAHYIWEYTYAVAEDSSLL